MLFVLSRVFYHQREGHILLQDYDIDKLKPTSDANYWDNKNASIKHKGSIPVFLSFPPTPQGDIDAVRFYCIMKENTARKAISIIEENINKAEPYGCGYFMAYSIPLAIDFFMLLLIWGIFNSPHR